MHRVAVIGGGISGIASAYYFNQHHIDVDLYDAAESIGGRIGGGFLGDRLIDFGGKNIGKRYKRITKLKARSWLKKESCLRCLQERLFLFFNIPCLSYRNCLKR
ncbi:MAG: FAD-dependent oxidoreductase [Chlorobiales bacterium]|nr:FAD-dependent oxidoreductase [Chlorobiales bacterium]